MPSTTNSYNDTEGDQEGSFSPC